MIVISFFGGGGGEAKEEREKAGRSRKLIHLGDGLRCDTA